jgi:hypothetical protein
LILDLSPSNRVLYVGLEVQELAGKPTLLTPPNEAIPVLLANLRGLEIDPEEVVLTGGMAIWAYLVVFHLPLRVWSSSSEISCQSFATASATSVAVCRNDPRGASAGPFE